MVIQELQVTPMGVITMIEPKNNDTDTRLGINLFQQVRRMYKQRVGQLQSWWVVGL
jgi:hypothetical protein